MVQKFAALKCVGCQVIKGDKCKCNETQDDSRPIICDDSGMGSRFGQR